MTFGLVRRLPVLLCVICELIAGPSRLRECAFPAPSVGSAPSERRFGRIVIPHLREIKEKVILFQNKKERPLGLAN